MATRLRELLWLFLKLGTLAFGGPAAHIAMMEDEVVKKRAWLTRAEFLDLLGATNLIPGPNSTELAIHIGHRRAGFPGLAVAGIAFIVPASLITLAIAWFYVRFGALPQAEALLVGVKPVMIAIVVQALWRLARSAVKSALLGAIAVAGVGASLLGVHELLVLAAAGALTIGARLLGSGNKGGGAAAALLLPGAPLVGAATAGVRVRGGERPAGPAAAQVPGDRRFLDGVNVASLALMATVTWVLARAAVFDWLTAALALGSAVALFRFKLNSVWLILAGAAVGVVRYLVGG